LPSSRPDRIHPSTLSSLIATESISFPCLQFSVTNPIAGLSRFPHAASILCTFLSLRNYRVLSITNPSLAIMAQEKSEYDFVVDNDPDLQHIRELGHGGFGSVHEIFDIRGKKVLLNNSLS
jgi:hypothetical protein